MMEAVWMLAGLVVGAGLAVGASVFRQRRGKGGGVYLSRPTPDKVSELSQLAGGLAHEIKNPLSTINVNLRLLAEDLHRYEDAEHRRWLRRLTGVQAEADRLKATLDDFQRLVGRIELSAEPVDLRSVVDDLVDFFAPQAEAQQVVLRSDLPHAPVPCRLDVKLMKQALLNLLINAAQAMAGGGELIVRVSIHDNQAMLEVIDTGPGLDPQQLERAFDVYYSTKQGGSGLGLPTTRRIVQEHHGQIRVDSEPGKGTRFTISVPLGSSE
ncbi:MAG: sensor histidine kinase [Planctomycetota bacterium]|jgi:signal transduction histidine kinase